MSTQTIQKARRLATEADQSQRQAEAYQAIAIAINGLDIPYEIKNEEVNRMLELANEFEEDADDRRALVDPELIDYL